MNKSLIVVTWDGKSKPLNYIYIDAVRNFDLLIFDHSAVDHSAALKEIDPTYYLSTSTENKGQVFYEVFKHLYANNETRYEYIGVLDDDIYTSYSDLNKLLFIGAMNALDVFQPCIAHDSYYDHRQFTHKPGYQIKEEKWVEIMAPFYKESLFKAAGPYFDETISGQGVDVYLMPCLQRIQGLTKTAVVHEIQVKHCRPVQSGKRLYSNGKTNVEEISHIRDLSIELINKHPQYFDEAFKNSVINDIYAKDIPMSRKWNRVKVLFKNLYKEIVNLSYR